MENSKSAKILSASELIVNRLPGGQILPVCGPKEHTPDGSWLELKQIQHALDERKAIIEEERMQKRGTLSQAIWSPAQHLALVTTKKGKHWEVMGFEKEGSLYLQPEEALFLLESVNLELYCAGVAISIQHCYELLLNKGSCTLDEYYTYAHFMRLGYKVVRHQGDSKITKYIRQIRLDQHMTRVKRKLSLGTTTSTIKKARNRSSSTSEISRSSAPGEPSVVCIVDDVSNSNQSTVAPVLDDVIPSTSSEPAIIQILGDPIPSTSNKPSIISIMDDEPVILDSDIVVLSERKSISSEVKIIKIGKVPEKVVETIDISEDGPMRRTFHEILNLLPNAIRQTTIHLNRPAPELLPPGITPFKETYVLNLLNIKNQGMGNKNNYVFNGRYNGQNQRNRGFQNHFRRGYQNRGYQNGQNRGYQNNNDYRHIENHNNHFSQGYNKPFLSVNNPFLNINDQQLTNYNSQSTPDLCRQQWNFCNIRTRANYYNRGLGNFGNRNSSSRTSGRGSFNNFRKRQSNYDNDKPPIEIPARSIDRGVKSWKEFKSRLTLMKGKQALVWKGDTKPLCQPRDATSTRNLLSKLKIIHKNEVVSLQPADLKISFDVYKPETTFRKSTVTRPDFRIVIARSEEPVPSPGKIVALQHAYSDDVPILFAVCSNSSISFMCLTDVDIPQMTINV